MPTPSAVVLLPTYNEKENLPLIVPAILQAAEVAILILDDNSPDGTGKIADQLALDYPDRVQVVHRPAKQGLGRAYVHGFELALAQNYRHILQMDADFSHPPAVLPQMIQLNNQYDLVLGSRWTAGGGTRHWPRHRQWLSRMGSLYARTVLGLRIADLTGGFKCFRRDALLAIKPESLHTNGYAFQIETTYRAISLGFKAVEIPIIFEERQRGQSKMSREIIWEAICKVPQLRRHVL